MKYFERLSPEQFSQLEQNKLVRLTVCYEPEIIEEIEKLASETGRTKSYVIRELIQLGLNQIKF